MNNQIKKQPIDEAELARQLLQFRESLRFILSAKLKDSDCCPSGAVLQIQYALFGAICNDWVREEIEAYERRILEGN
jgi:hypothetical protein